MRRLRVLLTISVVLITLAVPAAAIGISPGRITIDWQLGLQQQVKFAVFNNGAEAETFELQTSGESGNWLTLPVSEITLAAGERRDIVAALELPATLKPGKHEGGIVVVEKVPSAAAVGARIGVEGQVWVTVPYPPQWVDVKLTFSNQSGLIVHLSNPTAETMRTTAKIDVQRAGQDALSFDKGALVLAPGEGRNLDTAMSWDVGNYTVTASVRWDGGSNDDRIEFDLSEPVKPVVSPTGLPLTLIMAVGAAALLAVGGLMMIRSEKHAKK
jgi:hypothetical protein